MEMLRSFPVAFRRSLWSQGSKSTLDRNADNLPFVSDHKDSQPQGRLRDVYIGPLCSWSFFFLFYFNPCRHYKIIDLGYGRLTCCCRWLPWCSLLRRRQMLTWILFTHQSVGQCFTR